VLPSFPSGWGEPGQGRQGRQGPSPQELSLAVARGLHAGSTDVHIATGTTDLILIILTRPEALARWVPRLSHAGRPNSLAETGQLRQVCVITPDSRPTCRAQPNPDLL